MWVWKTAAKSGPNRSPSFVSRVVEIVSRFVDRAQQVFFFLLDALARLVVEVGQVDRILEPVHRSDGDAARGAHALQLQRPHPSRLCGRAGRRRLLPGGALLPLHLRLAHQGEQARVDHHRRNELRTGLEDVHLAPLELPGFAGLHVDHADGHVAHDERNGHERYEALSTRLRDVLVVRVLRRVLDHQRLALRSRQTHEPLADGNPHLAHGLRVQTGGGAEREPAEVGLDQIDRAGIRTETLGHELDDVAQGFGQVVRARDDRCDIGE